MRSLAASTLLWSIIVPVAGAAAQNAPNAQVPWLHEGAVLCMKWGAMSHSGQGTGFKLDQQGNWVGDDGTRMDAYSRPSGSASGVSEVIVTCIEKGHVCLIRYGFADMRLLGFPDPLVLGEPVTFFVPVSGHIDLWMPPAKLATLPKFDQVTHAVAQNIQWPFGGKQVDAIRVTTADQNHWVDHVYDRASGLCLHGAESSTGAPPELNYLAPGDTRSGDTMLSVSDLLSVRDQNTPWATEALPPWCGQFKVLHYHGTSGVPYSPFGGRPAELGLDVTRIDSGIGWLSVGTNGWIMFRGQPSPPKKGIIICGRDQYDSFFAGPAALAKLQQGQVLDEDPVTHVKTEVTQADGQSVTITSSSAGILVSHTFDVRSGKLVSSSQTDRQTHIVTTFQLQGEE
jgi:hypothetical protein